MPIRETFWNIPHWAEIAQYVLALVTVIVFLYGLGRRLLRWRKGQPEKRSGHFWARIWSLVVQVLGQRRTLDEWYPGIMHFTIFWGMLALAMGTALATVDWDVTNLFFGFQFLTGWVYILFELVRDVLGLLVIVGLGMAIYRRYVVRPARLQDFPFPSLVNDDLYVLVMLAFIAVSGYLTEGLRIAVTQPDWAAWSPVGKLIADALLALGDPTNQTLHLGIWLIHILTAFVILASKKINQSAKDPRKLTRLRFTKAELVTHINHEHNLLTIISQTFKQFHSVSNPECFMKTFLKQLQSSSLFQRISFSKI